MNKTLLAVMTVLLMAARAHATADPYSGFERYADAGSLKPFTRDLGGILGAVTFHNGRSLGFSGFDVGVRYSSQCYPSQFQAVRAQMESLGWLEKSFQPAQTLSLHSRTHH
jgi:hypothetical protein